jgi:2-succinyl-5-enolpyruvyl-6-hydroxy-3-cyclohexene-1-carboxylate synthase
MTNIERARALINDVCALGVNDFCVCAGSRNSPLLAVLGGGGQAPSPVRLYSFVDERSAAFFALGRAKRDGRPVAVVTTSGTAVAELLPAAVEAFYSATPIVLVTADRPARFRGTGAPQCIDQIGIFSTYAETRADSWSRVGPLHLNIEFDEPLIDE